MSWISKFSWVDRGSGSWAAADRFVFVPAWSRKGELGSPTPLAFVLALVCVCFGFAAGELAWAHAPQESYAAVSDGELDALVAPIALYPDPLVAQILGAATYPDQVVDADNYINANPGLTGQALADAVDQENWDPSVQALTQFPSVLDMMAKNIEWTSSLGDASANQQGDVMAAIQRMRAKAYAAGNLKSGQQIRIVKESPDVIVIQPANPQVIYVPAYNPAVIYGAPVVVPGYRPIVAGGFLSFGSGIRIGVAIGGAPTTCGWSYWSWRMNWSARSVYCGGGAYYGNPYWWGGYYPGYYPGYRPPRYYPPPRARRPPPPGWRPRPPYGPGYRPPRPTPPVPGRPNRPGAGQPSRPGNPPGRPGPGNPPTGGRPPGNPGRPGVGPGGPSIQPHPNPGQRPGPGSPTTKPAPGVPNRPPNSRESRGYPSQTKPAPQKPNAFSGTVGGRQESARGNRSLNPPPAQPPGKPNDGKPAGRQPR